MDRPNCDVCGNPVEPFGGQSTDEYVVCGPCLRRLLERSRRTREEIARAAGEPPPGRREGLAGENRGNPPPEPFNPA